MIFVDRNLVLEPSILSDPQKAGPKETLNAIKHYHGNPGATAFDYKVYRDPEVKDALITLFNGKCAYCDSTFLHVYSGDVEHFRPKGEIDEAMPDTKPGYYWLAADWNNLLLSCRNCNQKLKHMLHGQTVKKTMGKMNQFPLSDPSKYIRVHDHLNGIDDEESFRLLLNPCLDKPEKHLEYDITAGIIKAKKDAQGQHSAKGQKSIDVYVLQRMQLVLSREKVLIDIQAQIQRVKEAISNFNDHLDSLDTTKKFYFEKILKRELERLKKFMDKDEQYIGMARQIIGDFLKINFGINI
jgi:uncharacterized protein (TIGR02646 family)